MNRWSRRVAIVCLAAVPAGALIVAGPVVVGHALFALGFTSSGAVLMHNASWRGYTLAEAGDYLAAARVFGKRPADAYDRGNALTKAGLYEQALDAYDDALQADPEDEDARYNKALVQKILDTKVLGDGKTSGNANARANVEKSHGSMGDQKGDTRSVGIGYTGNKEGSSNATSQGGSKVSKIGTGQQGESGNNSEKASGSAGVASGRGRSGGDMVDAITAQLAVNQRKYSPSFTHETIRPNVEWLQTVPDDPGQYLKLRIRAEHKRREAQDATAQGDD